MILVTGATGLVGGYLVRELVNLGYQVRIIVRPTSDLSMIEDIISKIEIYEGNVLDVSTLSDAFNKITTVIHAAAIVSFHSKDEPEMMKTNIEGTANMVNLALDYQVKKFIYISSITAIGTTTNGLEISETTQWNPDFKYSRYAISKHQAELEVWRAVEEGLSAAIINPSVILGPAKHMKSSTKIFSQAKTKGFFTIDGAVNVVDLRDVISSILLLLTSEITSQRFIINGGMMSYTDLITKIRQRNEQQAPKYTVPLWCVKLYLLVRKSITFLGVPPSEITFDSLKALTKQNFYNGKKITNILGLEYTPIEDTLDWCCKVDVDK